MTSCFVARRVGARLPHSTLALGIGYRGILGPVLDLKSSTMQMAYGARQGHVEEFRSKKRGEHFEQSCLCSGVIFRNQKECRNNSSKNHLYISKKELPNTTRRISAKGETSGTHRNENLTMLDRVPILSRSMSRIQWAGFSHEGHCP